MTEKKTQKRKNVFSQLKKPVKGRGMSTLPVLKQPGNNTKKPEHTEAVPLVTPETRRTARISTYISEDSRDRLENITIQLRKKEGRKPKIAEVLERALFELEKKI